MESWYAPLPCSTCGHATGTKGVYVAAGVQFCVVCVPLVIGLLEAKEPHDRRRSKLVLQTTNQLSIGAPS